MGRGRAPGLLTALMEKLGVIVDGPRVPKTARDHPSANFGKCRDF